MQQNNNPQNGTISGKKMFIVIFAYFVLTLTSRYAHRDSHSSAAIAEKILNLPFALQPTDLYQLLEADQVYTGEWTKTGNGSTLGLTEAGGRFQFRLDRAGPFSSTKELKIELAIINGNYTDHGTLDLQFTINDDYFEPHKSGEKQATMDLKANSSIDSFYTFRRLIVTQREGSLLLNSLSISLWASGSKAVQISLSLAFAEIRVSLGIQEKENRLLKLSIFAVVAFVVSYIPFVGVMALLRGIYEGSVNPVNLSLFTVTVGTMWDATVCMVAFKLAFQDQVALLLSQQSLVLFIMPAFMLCMLFSNLQPRLMLAIFERRAAGCLSYNLLSYGSLLLIYPLVVVTNLNRVFFVGAACMLFPQIYLNATNGVRPEIGSSYYLKFVLSRYFVVLYLKTNPYNLFRLQPDYPLVLACAALLALQLALLSLQHRFGPKTIIPKCLLDPVFDYSHQEAVNLEEGSEAKECSICLSSLSSEPPGPAQHAGLLPANFRLMKTPCKHTYHASCLLSWMKIKMACPQCRSTLPPFQ